MPPAAVPTWLSLSSGQAQPPRQSSPGDGCEGAEHPGHHLPPRHGFPPPSDCWAVSPRPASRLLRARGCPASSGRAGRRPAPAPSGSPPVPAARARAKRGSTSHSAWGWGPGNRQRGPSHTPSIPLVSARDVACHVSWLGPRGRYSLNACKAVTAPPAPTQEASATRAKPCCGPAGTPPALGGLSTHVHHQPGRAQTQGSPASLAPCWGSSDAQDTCGQHPAQHQNSATQLKGMSYHHWENNSSRCGLDDPE